MDPTESSLAVIQDEIRPLIVAARERGEQPRYVVLDDGPFAAVEACKRADRERGVPMMLLGMEVVRADGPLARPRVF